MDKKVTGFWKSVLTCQINYSVISQNCYLLKSCQQKLTHPSPSDCSSTSIFLTRTLRETTSPQPYQTKGWESDPDVFITTNREWWKRVGKRRTELSWTSHDAFPGQDEPRGQAGPCFPWGHAAGCCCCCIPWFMAAPREGGPLLGSFICNSFRKGAGPLLWHNWKQAASF